MEVRQQNQREHSQAFTDGEGFVRNHEPASALGAEEAAGSRAQTGVWLPASRWSPLVPRGLWDRRVCFQPKSGGEGAG